MIKDIILVSTVFMTANNAYAMDELAIAGVYAVDRASCHLYVDQRRINDAILAASVRYNITTREATLESARIGTALQGQILETGRVNEYCEARRIK